MTDNRRATGAVGEQAAVRFLEARGYGILARNWRCARGELDIIAQDGRELVFVEVRTKRGTAYGSAEELITAVKRMRLISWRACISTSYAREEHRGAEPGVSTWSLSRSMAAARWRSTICRMPWKEHIHDR